MKPTVTIAAICFILLFAFIARCLYVFGDQFTEDKENFEKKYTEDDYACEIAIDTFLSEYFDDTTFIAIPPIIIHGENKQSAALYFSHYKHSRLSVKIRSSEFYCIDKGDTVYFIFEDGETFKTYNSSQNCDYNYTFTLDYTEDINKVMSLKTKPLKSIKLVNEREVSECFFTKSSQKNLMNLLSCFKS